MNSDHHIYEFTEEEKKLLDPFSEVKPEEKEKYDKLKEDIARLDGYLKGRADSDAPKIARGPGANKDLAG